MESSTQTSRFCTLSTFDLGAWSWGPRQDPAGVNGKSASSPEAFDNESAEHEDANLLMLQKCIQKKEEKKKEKKTLWEILSFIHNSFC